MDKIVLTGLQFWGFHGVFQEEQVMGQPFVIDLELKGDFSRAAAEDNLEYGINYAEVYARVKDLVEGSRCRLIEGLAELIAGMLLTEFPVLEVMVRVNKPHAPIRGIITNVAVEIVREKVHGK